jgi:hypothetical protein
MKNFIDKKALQAYLWHKLEIYAALLTGSMPLMVGVFYLIVANHFDATGVTQFSGESIANTLMGPYLTTTIAITIMLLSAFAGVARCNPLISIGGLFIAGVLGFVGSVWTSVIFVLIPGAFASMALILKIYKEIQERNKTALSKQQKKELNPRCEDCHISGVCLLQPGAVLDQYADKPSLGKVFAIKAIPTVKTIRWVHARRLGALLLSIIPVIIMMAAVPGIVESGKLLAGSTLGTVYNWTALPLVIIGAVGLGMQSAAALYEHFRLVLGLPARATA